MFGWCRIYIPCTGGEGSETGHQTHRSAGFSSVSTSSFPPDSDRAENIYRHSPSVVSAVFRKPGLAVPVELASRIAPAWPVSSSIRVGFSLQTFRILDGVYVTTSLCRDTPIKFHIPANRLYNELVELVELHRRWPACSRVRLLGV